MASFKVLQLILEAFTWKFYMNPNTLLLQEAADKGDTYFLVLSVLNGTANIARPIASLYYTTAYDFCPRYSLFLEVVCGKSQLHKMTEIEDVWLNYS